MNEHSALAMEMAAFLIISRFTPKLNRKFDTLLERGGQDLSKNLLFAW
jgi:hypothetical protein